MLKKDNWSYKLQKSLSRFCIIFQACLTISWTQGVPDLRPKKICKTRSAKPSRQLT